MIEKYKDYYEKKDYTSIGLFNEINKKFKIKKVLYAGSYLHITPSLVFSEVVYVDSDKRMRKFFDSIDVQEFIQKNKKYKTTAKFKAYQQDYSKPFDEKENSFDLLISQYAGFISQACKKYIKKGGILVVNNSHGDAGVAFLDNDFELIAVYNRKSNDKFTVSDKKLGEYFIPKKDVPITKEILLKTMKGIGYTKSPSGYIFKKIV